MFTVADTRKFVGELFAFDRRVHASTGKTIFNVIGGSPYPKLTKANERFDKITYLFPVLPKDPQYQLPDALAAALNDARAELEEARCGYETKQGGR